MVLISLVTANAQADTDHHRAIYTEINAVETSFQKVTGIHSNGSAFVAELKGKSGQKPAKPSQVAVGTFTGIEEGDYFHWNMRSDQGEDLSFFILNPDPSLEKALANPKAFAGKKCRVTWKKSTENIPEAGGPTEIDQILSVEWLTAK